MKYTVTGRVCAFGAGQKLKLSRPQIDARRHALEVVDEKSGKVITKAEVQFKAGETIDLDIAEDELPSSLAAVLTSGGASGKKKAGKAKAEKGAEGEPDFDALEDELEAAETALHFAYEKHGFKKFVEITDEQKALVAAELDRLTKAQAAYDAAVGE
ncbi:hypothetical protein [Ensifer sp. LCM 4579]|uniref:hypothetical protein n=1 Tax=Ensifer sp. LCM 4579 TaxID=1848292 RepID=UPI0008D940A6|nr:hypothetical protein [Ensifer sp. LCM 4579]OHV85952.1 hypothetical protein LCM4579_00900 [Ensifer sp. LCM 4579]